MIHGTFATVGEQFTVDLSGCHIRLMDLSGHDYMIIDKSKSAWFACKLPISSGIQNCAFIILDLSETLIGNENLSHCRMSFGQWHPL